MKLTKWLLLSTEIALPLYIVRCGSFDFCQRFSPLPFTLLEVMIASTVASWTVWKYQEIKSGGDNLEKLLQRLRTPILLPILIFLLAGLVNSFVAADVRGGLGIFKAYFLEGFLLYIVAFDFLTQTKQIRFFLSGFLISGLWLSGLGILEWVLRWNPFAPQELFLRDSVSGIYSTKNALGLFLAPVLILSVSWLSWEFLGGKKEIVWWLKVGVLVLLLGILVSGSRGAFLGLALSAAFVVAWLFFDKFKKTRLFAKLLGASFVVLLLGQILFFLNLDSFVPKDSVNNTAQSRICLWDGTKKLIAARPIFGSGLNGFMEVYPEYRTCGEEDLQYPHNIFLNFWVEVGLVGMVSFLTICSLQVRGLLKSNKNSLPLQVGLIAVFVAVLGHGLVDVPFFKNDLAAQFWLVLALGSYLLVKDSQLEGKSRQ